MLHREDFLKIISSNSQDYERFCEIKDKINFYQNVEDLYINCPSCSQKDHGVLSCPLLHLTLERRRIIARFTYSKEQERGKRRRRKIKICSRMNLKLNYTAAILINRNIKEKEKHSKEEDDCSDTEEESDGSSALEDEVRTSKRTSLSYIVDTSNPNLINSTENLNFLKPLRNINRGNSIISEKYQNQNSKTSKNSKSSLAYIDDGLFSAAGGGGGVGGGGGGGRLEGGRGLEGRVGLEGGGWEDGYRRTSEKKVSNFNQINLLNNLEKILFNVPSARRPPPQPLQTPSVDPFSGLTEISRNYTSYFPHNNIESIVNFIRKFYDNKSKRRKGKSFSSPDDLQGGERMVEGEWRMKEGRKKRKEGRRKETGKRKKKKGENRKEEGGGEKEEGGRREEEGKIEEGGKRSFFSSFFDREREMMKNKGTIDRERIVAMLRRLERKRKGFLERWLCFWK